MNDKYLHYQLEDFLQDDEFIALVKNNNAKPALLNSWLDKNFPDLKVAREAATLINDLRFKKELPIDSQKEKMWEIIDQKSSHKNIRFSSGKRLIYTLGGIAASLLFIIYFFGDVIFPDKMISATHGEHVSYELPDASKIDLNAETVVSFDKNSFSEDRKINMVGEAFFQVTKGSNFLVKTQNGDIKVLGTSFNVYSRENLFQVKCFSGKVMVVSANDSIYLNPGQGTSFQIKKNELEKMIFNPDETKIWKDGNFEFEAEQLSFVLQELQRQFAIFIELAPSISIEGKKYTGSFSNETLDKALKDVLWPLHFEYEINGKRVLISSSK